MNHDAVYIAGPMSNYPSFNYGAFQDAEETLRLLGYFPLSPARHGQINGYTWADYMRLGVRDVLNAAGVCLLPGWEASRGACLEVHVAHALGLPTVPRAQWARTTLDRQP